jgi:hypothetical protein
MKSGGPKSLGKKSQRRDRRAAQQTSVGKNLEQTVIKSWFNFAKRFVRSPKWHRPTADNRNPNIAIEVAGSIEAMPALTV